MRRRHFLAGMASTALLGGAARSAQLPADLKITRIVGFDLISRRPKFVGKNARRNVHGDRARDLMVRLHTNTGEQGLGNCWVSKQVLGRILGKNPFDAYTAAQRRFVGPLGTQTMPLWDLLGKVLNEPVYRLLGGKGGPRRVPVYDGSVYFSDLLPQYEDKWRDRFKQEIDASMKRGHRAVKVKIGRGNRWMPRDAGDQRDVEVVELIRKHGGAELLIGVDANNGYDLQGTKRLLRQLGELGIAFVEEMFPEEVEPCLELKGFVKQQGWNTLVADGETQKSLDAFVPLVQAKALDVLQGDMNGFGIEGIMAEAALAKTGGLLVAPHNWGSLNGFFMQLHVARAIDNFYRAEQDPLQTDLLRSDGYKIAEGECLVPDAAGFGLSIDDDRFADVKVLYDLKA